MAKKTTAKNKKTPGLVVSGFEIPKMPTMPPLAPWMKMTVVLFVFAVLAVVIVATQPNQFKVEREITISAPVDQVFAQVNDLHRWEAWSPWQKMDPSLTGSYTGSSLGVGSVYHWAGNSKVGEGAMVLTESEKNVHISVEVDFLKPLVAKDAMLFIFTPQGKETLVQWKMTGQYDLNGKIAHLFGAVDEKLADDFQDGLEQLKAVVQPGYKAGVKPVIEKPTASI